MYICISVLYIKVIFINNIIMQQSFEYLKVQTALDSITVENIGNIILQATNDLGLEWYLQIKTDNGFTNINEFGPLFRDLEITKYGFSLNIQRFDYNEKKICKLINNFLNNSTREITQVQEITELDLSEQLDRVKSIF